MLYDSYLYRQDIFNKLKEIVREKAHMHIEGYKLLPRRGRRENVGHR